MPNYEATMTLSLDNTGNPAAEARLATLAALVAPHWEPFTFATPTAYGSSTWLAEARKALNTEVSDRLGTEFANDLGVAPKTLAVYGFEDDAVWDEQLGELHGSDAHPITGYDPDHRLWQVSSNPAKKAYVQIAALIGDPASTAPVPAPARPQFPTTPMIDIPYQPGPDEEAIEITFAPTRTRLLQATIDGEDADLNAIVFTSRVGTSSGPQTLIGPAAHLTLPDKDRNQLLRIELAYAGEPPAGMVIRAARREPFVVRRWEGIIRLAQREVCPEHRFFFELDKRTNPPLAQFFVGEAAALALENKLGAMTDVLTERLIERWSTPGMPQASLPHADAQQIDTWFVESHQASGLGTHETTLYDTLPGAMARFAAGELRRPLQDYDLTSSTTSGTVQDAAGEPNSWFIFMFAEAALAIYEHGLDAQGNFDQAAAINPALWNLRFIAHLLQMQDLYLARKDPLPWLSWYKIPDRDAPLMRQRDWIADSYRGFDDPSLLQIETRFRRNLALAGALGIKP